MAGAAPAPSGSTCNGSRRAPASTGTGCKIRQRAGSVQVKAGAAGKVFKIEAGVGQTVKRGDAVVIIEAMKMEIPVVAPEDGTVASIDVAVGDADRSRRMYLAT